MPGTSDYHYDAPPDQHMGKKGRYSYDNPNYDIGKDDSKSFHPQTPQTAIAVAPKPEDVPKASFARAWTAIAIFMMCYNTAFMATIPVTGQYLTHRISHEWYNFTNMTKDLPCTKEVNNSATKTRDEIQKIVSSLSLFINYASSIPAIITCLPYGTLSDHIGRKKVMLIPLFGALVRTVVYLLVVALNLDLNYLFIGSVADGLCGSYHATSMVSAAVVADITLSAGNRAISFAIIECIVILSSALSNLSVGIFIEYEGYIYPTAMMSILIGVSILTVMLILPETLLEKKKISRNPLVHLKKILSFYFTAGSAKRRLLYRIGVCMFFLNIVVSLGRSTVETLYQLNSPFCWNSLKIGIFSSIQSSVQIICSILALKVLKTCISLEAIGIIALACAIGGFILEGLASVDLMLYLVPVVGLIIYTVTPISRALMSKMAASTEQGALFASLSVVDALCGILSFTLYSSVYIGTLGLYRGTVFFVMAGVCALNMLLFITFKAVSKSYTASESLTIDDSSKNQTKTNKGQAKEIHTTLNNSARYNGGAE